MYMVLSRFVGTRAVALLATIWMPVMMAGGAGLTALAQDQQPVPVEAEEVTVGAVREELQAVGSLRSNESVIVRPEIAGRIREIHFQEGQPVEKGQVLFTLDDSIYRAELLQAEARHELARRNLARTEELQSQGVVSLRAKDEQLAEQRVSEATVELARVRLEKTRILAPFSGIAGLRNVSVGDYVSAGQDLVNLENIQPIKVDFRLPERFLPAIRTDQHIDIIVDAFPGEAFDGEIYAIDPQIDPNGRNLAVRALVDNEDGRLRPGLFARVNVILEQRTNALSIPEQAIMPRGEDRYVYRIEGGIAHMVRVETGIRRDGLVEITGGLSPGDVVVTAGHLKIQDGSPVTPIKPQGTS